MAPIQDVMGTFRRKENDMIFGLIMAAIIIVSWALTWNYFQSWFQF